MGDLPPVPEAPTQLQVSPSDRSSMGDLPPVPEPPTRLRASDRAPMDDLPPVPEPPTRLHLSTTGASSGRGASSGLVRPSMRPAGPGTESRAQAWVREIANRAGQAKETLASWAVAARNRLQSGLDASVSYVEARRATFPEPIRRVLARVSSQVLVGGALVSVFLLLVLGSWLALGRHRTVVLPPPVASVAAPVASFASLASTAPPAAPSAPLRSDSWKQGFALLEQAASEAQNRRDQQAVALVARALQMEPDLRSELNAAKVVFQAAQSSSRVGVDTAFALLQSAMGQRGAELLYRVALDKNTPGSTRRRAEKWIRGLGFQRLAAEDLYVASKFVFTETCEEKRDFLDLAGRVGGTLALEALRGLLSRRGCGLTGEDDCYPCLRKDNRFEETLKKVEARAKG